MTDTKQAVRQLREALGWYKDGLNYKAFSRIVEPLIPAVLDRLEELDGIDHPHQARDCYFKISRDYYRELWETSCAHVGEACEILGVDPKETPADTWTLREAAARMVAERDAIRAKLADCRAALVQANETAEECQSCCEGYLREKYEVDSQLETMRANLRRFPALDSSGGETEEGREG